MQSKLDELSINGEDDFVLFTMVSMVQNVSTKEIIHSEISTVKQQKEIAALAEQLGGYVHAFSKVHGLILHNLRREQTNTPALRRALTA